MKVGNTHYFISYTGITVHPICTIGITSRRKPFVLEGGIVVKPKHGVGKALDKRSDD